MKKSLLALLVLLVGLIGLVIYNNRFAMIINQATVKNGQEKLAVEYALPKTSDKPLGLVLFIHGDGPANKNSDEGYYPAWETLAKENIISVSWDKPGVGQSTGNWLKQDMGARQKEAEKVLEWALANFDVDPDKVGVWGASQGGWVIPKLLNNNPAVKFAIGVAPAVNWLRQGTYNTISEMKNEEYSEVDIKRQLAKNAQVNDYLKADDYQGYLASGLEKEPLSQDRWDFIRKNMSLDNTAELAQIQKPYYLILGDHDSNVDTTETEKIYREEIGKDYLTIYPIENATHRMLKPRHQKDSLLTVIEAIINPREIFAPEYLKALETIGKKI